MLMPSLTKQRAKLDHLNCRSERHGEDNVPTVDLKISFETSNEILDRFSPDMRPSFYRKPTKNDPAELFDGTADALPLRVLKMPRLGAQNWKEEYPGYGLVIAYGVSGQNDLTFTADVDKFVFDCKEGGTVAVTFRAIVKPDGEMDALIALLQSEIELTLTPPSETQQQLEAA